jgi:hypothetical protein
MTQANIIQDSKLKTVSNLAATLVAASAGLYLAVDCRSIALCLYRCHPGQPVE